MNEEISRVVARLEDAALSLLALYESDTHQDLANPEIGSDMRFAGSPIQSTGKAKEFVKCPPLAGQKSGNKAPDLDIVEAMISIRFLRDRFFERDLFFDPTWSMLIDLYRAELKGKQLSVTSVCIGSRVADTTALRYIKLLEERGYVYRVPDPNDKRRVFLRLTGEAIERMRSYFGSVGSQCRAA